MFLTRKWYFQTSDCCIVFTWIPSSASTSFWNANARPGYHIPGAVSLLHIVVMPLPHSCLVLPCLCIHGSHQSFQLSFHLIILRVGHVHLGHFTLLLFIVCIPDHRLLSWKCNLCPLFVNAAPLHLTYCCPDHLTKWSRPGCITEFSPYLKTVPPFVVTSILPAPGLCFFQICNMDFE